MMSWKAERVFRRSWWAKRPALVTAGLALLGGTSAILTAAKATNPLALAGADGAAAASLVFGAAWQERYRRHAQRRDDQGFRLQNGCFVLADGRLPFARQITNPVVLGVHQAAAVPATEVPESAAGIPAYVPRDGDGPWWVTRRRARAGRRSKRFMRYPGTCLSARWTGKLSAWRCTGPRPSAAVCCGWMTWNASWVPAGSRRSISGGCSPFQAITGWWWRRYAPPSRPASPPALRGMTPEGRPPAISAW